jgi:hypothetical protein
MKQNKNFNVDEEEGCGNRCRIGATKCELKLSCEWRFATAIDVWENTFESKICGFYAFAHLIWD